MMIPTLWLIKFCIKINGYGKTLASVKERLSIHLSEYQHVFKNKTKKFFDTTTRLWGIPGKIGK
jgi:hypothetical protein